MGRLAAKDPQLAALMKGLLGSGRGSLAVRLIAFDLSASSVASRFFTNLNVLLEPTDLPLAAWRVHATAAGMRAGTPETEVHREASAAVLDRLGGALGDASELRPGLLGHSMAQEVCAARTNR